MEPKASFLLLRAMITRWAKCIMAMMAMARECTSPAWWSVIKTSRSWRILKMWRSSPTFRFPPKPKVQFRSSSHLPNAARMFFSDNWANITNSLKTIPISMWSTRPWSAKVAAHLTVWCRPTAATTMKTTNTMWGRKSSCSSCISIKYSSREE